MYSSLIHDLDHPGVPNTQLIEEQSYLASRYKNKSIAEQNSVDLAWNLLLENQYNELRMVICFTPEECIRFRQLVVNSVMATDISDKDLKKLRDDRWKVAFATSSSSSPDNDGIGPRPEEPESKTVNRKVTIVLEHLIQASDVSHTMQHWHIYIKWNERLFHESWKAYQNGRSPTNPLDNW